MFKKTKIMGILNVTPDSFYDGGSYDDPESSFQRAVQIVEEGADIIDIGGESTRPGSSPVGLQEEMDRVCPVIERISSELDVKISVDTYKARIAMEALKQGASMVNDISGLTFDSDMVKVVAEADAEVVLMHIKGEPRNMQNDIDYADEIEDVLDFLRESVSIAVNEGVRKDRIILDPGIGFGKSLDHNYRLIENLERFTDLGFPVMMALSRKSLIGKIYDDPDADRLPGTIALNSIAVRNGAEYIRVHDVKQHRLAMDAVDYLKRVSLK